MENYKYWKVVVVFLYPTDSDKVQKVKEEHLVNAVSPTEAEAIIHKQFGTGFEFEITGITQTRFISVIEKEEE